MKRLIKPDFTVTILDKGYLITADLISNPEPALQEIANSICTYDPDRDIISDAFNVPDLDRANILDNITLLQDQLLVLYEKYQLFERFMNIYKKLHWSTAKPEEAFSNS